MKPVLLLAMCAVCVACGQRPAVTGITTNRSGLVKTRLGPSPADLAARVIDGRSDQRGQLVGDPAPERLVRLPGSDTIEVRNAADVRIAAVTTPFHITDFGTVAAPDGVADGSAQLVVHTYPNASQGATYTVFAGNVFDGHLREVTRWDELPATSRFATASWRGSPAVFYLQGDVLVVRAADGRQLARLPAPDAGMFSEVHVLTASDARVPGRETVVVVASGNGYTPYHMVAVYDAGQLVFHEVGDEHAFEVSSSAGGFVVSTRSARWEYRLPGH